MKKLLRVVSARAEAIKSRLWKWLGKSAAAIAALSLLAPIEAQGNEKPASKPAWPDRITTESGAFRLPPIPYLEEMPWLKDATWSGRKIDWLMQPSLPDRLELSPVLPNEGSPSLS
jgi:hypothetical protein